MQLLEVSGAVWPL